MLLLRFVTTILFFGFQTFAFTASSPLLCLAENLDLYANALSGTIPSFMSKLGSLRELDVHDNNFVGTMPKAICEQKLDVLVSDCYGKNKEVKCDCCQICCEGLPHMRCVDMRTNQEIIIGMQTK